MTLESQKDDECVTVGGWDKTRSLDDQIAQKAAQELVAFVGWECRVCLGHVEQSLGGNRFRNLRFPLAFSCSLGLLVVETLFDFSFKALVIQFEESL